MIKKIFRKQFSDIEKEIKKDITFEIKEIAIKMIRELLSEENDEERVNTTWGSFERKTLAGFLKEGIKDKVLSEMEKEEKERVMRFINGEEFIDKIVDRIIRKQLN